jgi:uncharacterized membrane protein
VVPDALLPEWVPNAHPLIVHFPIALVFVAVAADALALWLGARWRTGREVATGLYVATGLSAVGSYYSGTWAVSTVTVATPAAAETLSTHAFWAWYTMVSLGLYAAVRAGGLFVASIRGRRDLHALLFVIGLGTLFPVYKTGENGGAMVYRRGVGVTQTQTAPGTAPSDAASNSPSGAHSSPPDSTRPAATPRRAPGPAGSKRE